MTEARTAGGGHTRHRLAYAAALILFLIGAYLTWRRSGELLIDFGRELYLAWRLSEGDVLYRDVASLMGPLAPYFNSSLFRVFGASITIVLASNLVIALLVMIAIGRFWLFVKPHVLFGLLVVFLVLSVFAHVNKWAVFNFITPYSHDATLGTLLAILALVSARRAVNGSGPTWWLLAGLATGCTFLTKPDIFVAAIAGAAAMLIAQSCVRGAAPLRTALAIPITWFAAGLLVPPLIALLLFLSVVPPGDALTFTAGAWAEVLSAGSPRLHFYRRVTGFDAPFANAAIMVTAAAAWLVPVTIGRWLSGRPRDFLSMPRFRRVWITIAIASVVLISMIVLPIAHVFRGFPLLVALVAVAAWRRIRTSSPQPESDRWIAVFGWAVFSFAMMAKSILNVKVDFYGFYLSLPAALLLTWYALEAIPEMFDERGASAGYYRRIISVVGAALLLLIAATSAQRIVQRTDMVGTAGDRVRYEPGLSGHLSKVVDVLQERSSGSESLIVLPEGAGLNFLMRRVNPIGHVSFLPPEFAAFSSGMLAALGETPPAYVLMWTRPLPAYGYDSFTTASYAREVVSFVNQRYRRVATIEGRRVEGGASAPTFMLYELDAGWQVKSP